MRWQTTMKQSFGTPTMRPSDVLDVAGFVASFTEDGVFNNVVALTREHWVARAREHR